MADYEKLIKDARLELDSAEHLLFVTFNLNKDSNFIFAVTNQLINSVKLSLESLLTYERKQRNIEPFPKQFNVMADTFKKKVAERREFDPVTIGFLRKMVELELSLKSSSIHYRRDDNYVVADQDYSTTSYDMSTIKTYFSQAQDFVNKVGEIIVED
jgi:hypothetical protein